MTDNQKKEFIKSLNEIYLFLNENKLGNPCKYMDYSSNKNLDLKIKTLQRMLKGKELSTDELYNKDVFEKLPSGRFGVDYQLD